MQLLGSVIGWLFGDSLATFISWSLFSYLLAYVLYFAVIVSNKETLMTWAIGGYAVYALLNAMHTVSSLVFVIPPLLYKHHVLDDLNSAARTWGLVCVYVMLVLGVVVAAVAIPVQVHELLIFLHRRRAPVTQHPAPVF